ncbi:hypothetical protein F444_14850 [Phytophthora nicotianae P1976]|uniref:Reverse transcriptase domain-containing protein n=1 Tax=Phytophthora nicotianae P1976 TaxID=1317066 RepID=A0A080ZNT7_PHYNI|nr:hypothetical protein F444_14850 [Phytophthora nicotianae P1976]
MALELLPGEMRQDWRGNQQRKGDLLLDSGAEVSILDAAFARKVGCYVDESRQQECVGIGEGVYLTKGRTKIKVTLVGSLVYFFDVWVGEMTGQDAILGMDFMFPAGIRLDLADGTLCLPDEIRIQLSGRRPLYGEHVSADCLEELEVIEAGQKIKIPLRSKPSEKLWLTRGEHWIPTLVEGAGWRRYLQVTNISDRTRWLPAHTQNLVLQATTDALSEEEALIVEAAGPMFDHPQYDPSKSILKRPAAVSNQIAKVSDRRPIENTQEPPMASQPLEDDQVCISEGGELFAEDVDSQMAVLPEVTTTTEDVKLEDIRIENDGESTPDEVDRLRKIIWNRQHLLLGKGNALPPAARGVVCDIDTGDAKPVAQRVRRVALQFGGKLSDLIKGLLSAKIIRVSSSPWASPIVLIIKKNGVDIRLCIDYRVVNSLTRLMLYSMPLVNDLLEDLDKREPAFITPFGLFEWLRMPFGLKNAPQIYQRLLDNALYGYLRIPEGNDQSGTVDVFQRPIRRVLGRRSYIDDILVTAESWKSLCDKVDRLVNACDRWNLSISVVKSSWGCRKVDHLGHRVSADGLKAHPKNLETLTTLPFPRTLRAMQSFLGSLNYYSRFIEGLAIYASILYELREIDFHGISRNPGQKTGDEVRADEERLMAQMDERDKWDRAQAAFEMLKNKIATAPVLQHFDPKRVPVVVSYAEAQRAQLWHGRESDPSSSPDPGRVLLHPGHETDQGRLGNWAALLSPWTLETVKCTRGEDEILAVIPTVEQGEELLVVGFDGSARVKRGGGACSAIVWKLPEWIVVAAESKYLPDLMVNEAEYQPVVRLRSTLQLGPGTPDHLRGLQLGDTADTRRDRVQGTRPDPSSSTGIGSAENVAGPRVPTRQAGLGPKRGQELLLPKDEGSIVRMAPTTRPRTLPKNSAEVLQLDVVERSRTDRILRAQNEEKWIVNLKAYLSGDLESLDAGEA